MLVASLLAGAAAMTPQTASAADADVVKGIGLVKAGDYERALLTLDLAIKNLAQREPRSKDLAIAHLYMGIAYANLGHDLLAKASFKQALKLNKSLRLDPKEFPPNVIKAFESARKTNFLLTPRAGVIGAIGGGTLAVITTAGGLLGAGALAATQIGDTTTTTTTTTMTIATTITTTTTLPCGDMTPPQVALTLPTPNASVSGSIPLRAAASDNVGVTEVRFLVDARVVGSASPPFFETLWDSRTASNGPHELTARAFDACGNQGFSPPVMINVRN